MLSDEDLLGIEEAIESEDSFPKEMALQLLEELRRWRRQAPMSPSMDSAYVDEIQRLNQLVSELLDYVDTVADVVDDSLTASDVPTDIKKKALDMIVRSVRVTKENRTV